MDFIPVITHLSTLLDSSSIHQVNVDGVSLSLQALVSVARHNTRITIDESTRTKVQSSQKVLQEKLEANVSIYGVSTGFGGSASTRTQDHSGLGLALFQMQHCGIISSIHDHHPSSTTMPESWVRAAILVRINSLIRGHSGVRWELPLALQQLLLAGITPLVPLRGSISASGDLSPLSYIAGTLIGNPSIKVYDTCSQSGQRVIVPSNRALSSHQVPRLILHPKEHLGLLNGTAFSAAVASLALYDAVQLAFLTEVCTAMATEALLGSRGSFLPFVNEIARPHPGQIDVARTILTLLDGSKLARTPQSDIRVHDDKGVLKQDRYALRTSPQFIGPQVEDIHAALVAVTRELNSTTDNPLIESATKMVHDTGNFQAMAVTNSMEKTRLSLHHLGKILFAQFTEMMNPDTNKGLPPSLAATDPSLNFHCKGVEISLAAYVSELGFLANPVSTHIQSAEMHNQAVNSLALLSARQTVMAVDVLTMIIASCLYASCQALDLRALQFSLVEGFEEIIRRVTIRHLQCAEEPLSPTEGVRCEHPKKVLTESGMGACERTEPGDPDLIPFSFHKPGPPDTYSSKSTTPLMIPGTSILRAKQERKAELEKISLGARSVSDLETVLESQTPDVDGNLNNSCGNNTIRGDFSSDSSLSDEESILSPGSSFTSIASFSGNVQPTLFDTLIRDLTEVFMGTFWKNTAMDAAEQVHTAVDNLVSRLLQEVFQNYDSFDILRIRGILPEYRVELETECLGLLKTERECFLTCPVEKLPTPEFIGLGSRHIYRFIRNNLGIRMHGVENLVAFEGGLNSQEATTGEHISLIYDCIKDGRIQPVLRDIINNFPSNSI